MFTLEWLLGHDSEDLALLAQLYSYCNYIAMVQRKLIKYKPMLDEIMMGVT